MRRSKKKTLRSRRRTRMPRRQFKLFVGSIIDVATDMSRRKKSKQTRCAISCAWWCDHVHLYQLSPISARITSVNSICDKRRAALVSAVSICSHRERRWENNFHRRSHGNFMCARRAQALQWIEYASRRRDMLSACCRPTSTRCVMSS